MNASCSLENCHTNLFALQTLNDLKWKCFRTKTPVHRNDSNKDPVLLAFWKLSHEDILCAWRRILIDDRQTTARELWVFTTHEDSPSDFPNLQPILSICGSWGDSPMSYDCRVMLFKALHNRLERYLLSKGFTRLNKWFVLPVNNNSDVKVPNLSFNFHFFLHGGSKICASIHVQQHQYIFHLTSDDLEEPENIQIILAPYGISAKLIGSINRDVDINVLRESWKSDYPLRRVEDLPEFVEVALGNLRMIYPTCYIFKTESFNIDSLNISTTNVNTKKSNESTKTKTKLSNVQKKQSTLSNRSNSSFTKQIVNDLIVDAQRYSCVDLNKTNSDVSLIINDPVNLNVCECSPTISMSSRPAALIPFHRRPKPLPTPVLVNERTKFVEPETNDDTIKLNTPIDCHTLETTSSSNHRSTSIINESSSPSNNPIQTDSEYRQKIRKRTAKMAFHENPMDGSDTDDEYKDQQQIYNFSPTDLFLQSVLKKSRPNDNCDDIHNSSTSAFNRHENLYQNGQPTPPSPSNQMTSNFHVSSTSGFESDRRLSDIKNSYSLPLFRNNDGPSMDDLETIIETEEQHSDNNELLEKSVQSNRTEEPIFSPNPKENVLPTANSTIGSTPITTNDSNHSSNRTLYGESIYITPPGSSSSDKFQLLHSPYGILVESANYVSNTSENQFQLTAESIIVPFETRHIVEQTSYNILPRINTNPCYKRYEPSISSNSILQTYQQLQRWRTSNTLDTYLPNLSNMLPSVLRRQPDSVATTYSPVRSTDNRSVGSTQTMSSPLTTMTSSSFDIDASMLNTFLNDSILNHFRDINFESCVLCPCKTNELSIHGNEALIYLENTLNHIAIRRSRTTQSFNSFNTTNCSCGFSAVDNLRLSLSSGLLYEDEIEITGIKADAKYREPKNKLTAELLEYIEAKESNFSPLDFYMRRIDLRQNSIEHYSFYKYENNACLRAIEYASTNPTILIAEEFKRHRLLNQWSYKTTPLESNQQMIAMLRSLKPLFIDALKKTTVAGSRNTVDGPLTWKSFHQLLHVQNQHQHLEEQISGPQPIPHIVAGFDRECINLAPYALKYWDKLYLEPYSKQKDVLYVAIVPDNDYVCSLTKYYLRELSCAYELCRLGLHRPCGKTYPHQGLLRTSSVTTEETEDDHDSSASSIDTWLNNQTQFNSGLIRRLKQCAQIIKHQITNLLATKSLNTALFDEQVTRRDGTRFMSDFNDNHTTLSDIYACKTPSPSASTTNSNIYPTNTSTTTITTNAQLNGHVSNVEQSINLGNNLTMAGNISSIDSNDLLSFESYYHGKTLNDDQVFLVIYVVDTFRYELLASNNEQMSLSENFETFIKTFIFRIYIDLIKILPEKIAKRIEIQTIPFEMIVQHKVESNAELRTSHFKRVAFHIYNELKRTVSYTKRAKALTSLGPAATEEKLGLNEIMHLYTPAYVLSSKFDCRNKPLMDLNEKSNLNAGILYCSYCLSDDQRYVLVSCTDERGELLETCSINIEIPDRSERNLQRAGRIAVQKVWDFILKVITRTSLPWRIVLGRLGRLGHSELKHWGLILSKKNLVRCAISIRESCTMCHTLRSYDNPMILSACLISLNVHPHLRIVPESFEINEIRSGQTSNNNVNNLSNHGNIFNDVSVTHILTFPTSPSVQHYEPSMRPNDSRQISNDDDGDIFGGILDEDMTSPPPVDLDFPTGNPFDFGYPSGSLNRFNSLSTSQNNPSNPQSYTNSSGLATQRLHSLINLETDLDSHEIPTLHQQPLALGFYVSTIGTLTPLPSWIWNNDLQQQNLDRSNKSSSVFKAALHINIPNVQHSDDILLVQNTDHRSIHPLDSNYTYVVLRYVLESYHRLSWLLMDAKSNERASCLPIHIERLLSLYQAFMKFV